MNYRIAVVMPAYNESECIEKVINNWTDFLIKHFPNQSKLIVVNDGSKDNTGQIISELAQKNEYLIAVTQANGGHGKAVVRAYEEAISLNPEWVFQTDSDDQFVCEDVLSLWAKKDDSNFILGFRQQRFDAPFRLFVTRVLKASLYFIYGTSINDSNIPFRLIKTAYLKKLLAQLPIPTPFAPNIFLSVLATKAGQSTFDLPITHKNRETGEVSIQKMKLLEVCWQSFKELYTFRKELSSKVKNLKSIN